MTETTLPAATGSRTRIDALLADYERLWDTLDALLDGLTADDWTRAFGKAWSYADLPYHLAYFDRELVAYYLGHGQDLTDSDRWLMDDEGKVDAWNARMFARRPAGQTVSQTLAGMLAARDDVRQAVAKLTDAGLA